jgi:predicted CXXCH cytochrome family protein
MINCLLIKVSFNKRNMPVRSYRTLTAEELTIGRGAECSIHLLDPRLAMHHAVIKRLDDGQIYLLALNGDLEDDDAVVKKIVLTHGKQVTIGPYLLTVEPAPPDVNISVSILLSHRLPDDFQDIKARTHEPLIGASDFKRKLAAWMVAIIVLVFIVLPLAQNLIPQFKNTMEGLPLGFDRVWSPGHISNAHLHFGSQCFNCHEKLTQKVTDQACLKCHQDTPPHIAAPSLQKKVFKHDTLFSTGITCAECHREHKAPHPLARQDNQVCVKCHGNIKAVNADTKLPDINDFDQDHPGFKLTFLRDGKKIERIPQTETVRLVEKSGLKFPHSQHFGKVQGPNGVWDVRELLCTTCHQQEGKEMRIKSVSFERDCRDCHESELKLGSDAAAITVPHGVVKNVINAIKVQAPKQVSAYSDSLKTDGCAYCHEVQEAKKSSALAWQVMPLSINEDWFSKAHFNHASHRTQKCQSCHQVEESETSEDVAMPDRKSCLRCHSGNSPKSKRIVSTCMSCHDFHDLHAVVITKSQSNAPKK